MQHAPNPKGHTENHRQATDERAAPAKLSGHALAHDPASHKSHEQHTQEVDRKTITLQRNHIKRSAQGARLPTRTWTKLTTTLDR